MLPLYIPANWILLSFMIITVVMLVVNSCLNITSSRKYDSHLEVVLKKDVLLIQTVTIISTLFGGTAIFDYLGDVLMNKCDEIKNGVVKMIILALLIIPDFCIFGITKMVTIDAPSLFVVFLLWQYSGCCSTILVMCNKLSPALFSTREPVNTSIITALVVSFGLWGYIVVCGIASRLSSSTLTGLRRDTWNEASSLTYSVVTLLTLGVTPAIGGLMLYQKGVEFTGTLLCIMIISNAVFSVAVCKFLSISPQLVQRESPSQGELCDFVMREIQSPLSFIVDDLRQLRTDLESGQLEQESIAASLRHCEAAAMVVQGVAYDVAYVSGNKNVVVATQLRRHHIEDLHYWLTKQSLFWSSSTAVDIKLDISRCEECNLLIAIIDFSKLDIVFRNLVSMWMFKSECVAASILVTVSFDPISHHDLSNGNNSDHHKAEPGSFSLEIDSADIPSKPAWTLIACYRWVRGEYNRGSRVQDHAEGDLSSREETLLEGLHQQGEVVVTIAYSGVGVSGAAIQAVLDAPADSQRRRVTLLGSSASSFEAGLLLSRDIVRLHGGWLSVRSSGRGHAAVVKLSIHLFAYVSLDNMSPRPVESTDHKPNIDTLRQSADHSRHSELQLEDHSRPWQSQPWTGTGTCTDTSSAIPLVPLRAIQESSASSSPPFCPSSPCAEMSATQLAPLNPTTQLMKEVAEKIEEELVMPDRSILSNRSLEEPDTCRRGLHTAVCDVMPSAYIPALDALDISSHGNETIVSQLERHKEGLREEEEGATGEEERREEEEGAAGEEEEEERRRANELKQKDKEMKHGAAPLIWILVCDDNDRGRNSTRLRLKRATNSIRAAHIAAARARSLTALITKEEDADCDIDDVHAQIALSSHDDTNYATEPADFLIDAVSDAWEAVEAVLDSIHSSSPFQCIFVPWNLFVEPGEHIASALRSQGYTGFIIGLTSKSHASSAAAADMEFRAYGGTRLLTAHDRHLQIYSVMTELHDICWRNPKFAQADGDFAEGDDDSDESY